MTEAEWLACDDPTEMLDLFQSQMSDRKLRLFAVACCRRIWDAMIDERAHRAIEVAERFADQAVSEEELAQASEAAEKAYGDHLWSKPDETLDALNAASCFSSSGREYWGQFCAVLDGVCRASAQMPKKERSAQALLLRDIFGNPFRPVALDPAWLTSDALALARDIYDERAFDRMPILADALQDAGCDNAEVLEHCRNGGAHVRGCWVVDLVLGKS